jgi:hypothetical protein
MTQVLIVAVLLLGSSGCALIGSLCRSRQEHGTVATLTGSVAAGQVVMHLIPYDSRGSQNNVVITWPGARAADAPRLQAFATSTACEAFTLPADVNTGACVTLRRGGWSAEGVVSDLIVTHGRGNPERLGTPPAYKLWIVSDQTTGYRISVSYFYGPDC